MSNKFQILSVKPSRKLVSAISHNRGEIPLDVIKSALSYNIMSVQQLSELTGVHQTRIFTLSVESGRPKAHKSRPKLNRVYPFQTMDGLGPTFILRDAACDEFILQSNK